MNQKNRSSRKNTRTKAPSRRNTDTGRTAKSKSASARASSRRKSYIPERSQAEQDDYRAKSRKLSKPSGGDYESSAWSNYTGFDYGSFGTGRSGLRNTGTSSRQESSDRPDHAPGTARSAGTKQSGGTKRPNGTKQSGGTKRSNGTKQSAGNRQAAGKKKNDRTKSSDETKLSGAAKRSGGAKRSDATKRSASQNHTRNSAGKTPDKKRSSDPAARNHTRAGGPDKNTRLQDRRKNNKNTRGLSDGLGFLAGLFYGAFDSGFGSLSGRFSEAVRVLFTPVILLPAIAKWAAFGGVLFLIISMTRVPAKSTTSFDTMDGLISTRADLAETEPADNLMIRRLYGLNAADYTGISAYVPTSNMGAQELCLIQAASDDAADAALAAMEARLSAQLASFNGYGVDQTAMLEKAIVISEGGYVIYYSGSNPDSVESAFRSAL